MGFQVGEAVEVEVGDVAQGGWCVARPSGLPVVFVRHALPGERVVAQVTEVTSRFARADAVEILLPSPDRVPAPCPYAHAGGCGGCDWQHAALPAQRALKAAVIGQHLRRLAGIDREVTVEPMPGDEASARSADGTGGGLGWRTRVQFAVRADGVAGLRAHRSHEVVDIGDCLIAHPGIRGLGIPRRRWPGVASVEAVVGSAGERGGHAERTVILTPAGHQGTGGRRGDAEGGEGAGNGGERAGHGGDGRDRSVYAEEPGVAAVPADAVLSRSRHGLTPVRGGAYIRQRAVGRDWRVGAGTFWQAHPAAADTLTAVVLAALEPKPGDAVLDLYCGAGLFAGAIAPAVGPDGAVIGIESDAGAVRDARRNLRDWPWARVHRGDVAQVLRRGGLATARLVVADPPRAGLARAVVGYLSGQSRAERFGYVSCDPATLARDLGLLLERGWTLAGLRAFDAFPMTHHVECVATVAR
ncbi:class I SAM-dependent RNA methyltransferase [Trebonia sp.]|uniref:class I SAM-dependent RNA methyltransferase n=1 Tax=Trebonia sp. TaxID=2767075 RepID=UPI00262E24D0|nr:TRAM domain-containing protein [Trebonia sp.]